MPKGNGAAEWADAVPHYKPRRCKICENPEAQQFVHNVLQRWSDTQAKTFNQQALRSKIGEDFVMVSRDAFRFHLVDHEPELYKALWK